MTEPRIITGWHFAGATLRDGKPLPRKGDVLRHEGAVEPCESGYHASKRAIDALQYAPGAWVARVQLSGTIKAHGSPVDKHCASERTSLTDYVDAARVLHEFACDMAEQALTRVGNPDPRSLRAIEVKRLWLLGAASNADLATARDAARDAAGAAAGAAAWAAAWAAARAAAWAAARDAAWDAARATARDAAGDALNAQLTARLEALYTEEPV